MAKTKTTKNNLNEKFIIVGHNVKGELLGHPILGLPAGKVMTRKEVYDVFLALAYHDFLKDVMEMLVMKKHCKVI